MSKKLEDVMALLAYEDPEKSPMFHLLSFESRQQVADNLNRAILEHANHPGYTPMEKLVQQVTVVRQYLSEENGKDAFPLFSLKDSLKWLKDHRAAPKFARRMICFKQ